MSFFVSDSIKNRVDESCLAETEEIEKPSAEYTFMLTDQKDLVTCHELKEVVFKKNRIEIFCDLNLSMIDKILESAKVTSINFKKVSILISRSRIIKIIRNGQDSYNVKITCYPREGENSD